MDSAGDTPKGVGCPIRTSEDQRLLATPLGFSQRATSFIASRCQGIHQMPFSRARPRPAPSTHVFRAIALRLLEPHARLAEDRGQTTEDRQRCRNFRPLFCSLFSVIWSLEPSASRPGLRPGVRIPMPGSGQTDKAGPASRFHDSLHDVKRAREQRTERTIRPLASSASSKRQDVRDRRLDLPFF
jgi:hypothetical protein